MPVKPADFLKTMTLETELEPVVVASIEVVQSPTGKISIRNVMIRDHTNTLRDAVVSPVPPANHILTEPQSIVFFKGNCVWYLNRWWC